jgi:hypothetical protein
MSLPRRTLLVAALLVASSGLVRAQKPADPTGHWEGTVQAPGMTITFEIDFAKDEKGGLAGTANLPAERIKGLPLTKIVVEGATISFQARSDQPMRGELSADGKTISGDYLVQGNTLPFTMRRAGGSKMQPPPKSAPISGRLEGTWDGTIESHGVEMRLRMILANHADGTSSGRIVNLDQGELELPVAIAQNGSSVTLDIQAVVSSYSGTLNADGTELAGTFTQGDASAALTFRRAAADRSKEKK